MAKVEKFTPEDALSRAAAIISAGPNEGNPPAQPPVVETTPPATPVAAVVETPEVVGGAQVVVEPKTAEAVVVATEVKPEDVMDF